MTTKTRSGKSRKIGPAIVRTWFDTVLNPIEYGLAIEESVLRRGDPTWRSSEHRLASILPAREHVQGIYYPNLDQFLLFHADLKPTIDEHDQRVNALSVACSGLDRAIVESPLMREIFEKLAPLGDVPALLSIFGAGQPDRCIRVLAEYLINDVKHLSHFYSTSEFWNSNRDRFLVVLETQEVRPHWLASRAAAASLFDSVVGFLANLREVRNRLSLLAGVPIVELRPA